MLTVGLAMSLIGLVLVGFLTERPKQELTMAPSTPRVSEL